MEPKKQFEELHNETLRKFETYMKSKGDALIDHDKTINVAKDKWQVAWNEFLETLLILEKLEI